MFSHGFPHRPHTDRPELQEDGSRTAENCKVRQEVLYGKQWYTSVYIICIYVYYYILGLLEMGYPQVTMGFNTKMVYCNLDDLGLTPFQETAIYIYIIQHLTMLVFKPMVSGDLPF